MKGASSDYDADLTLLKGRIQGGRLLACSTVSRKIQSGCRKYLSQTHIRWNRPALAPKACLVIAWRGPQEVWLYCGWSHKYLGKNFQIVQTIWVLSPVNTGSGERESWRLYYLLVYSCCNHQGAGLTSLGRSPEPMEPHTIERPSTYWPCLPSAAIMPVKKYWTYMFCLVLNCMDRRKICLLQ